MNVIMSRWTESFQGQQALQRVQASIASLEKIQLDSFPAQHHSEYERALKVLKVLEARFSNLDPELFNQNQWGNFGPWLSNAQAQAEAAFNNPSANHIIALNTYLDEILAVFKPIDIKFAAAEVKAITDARRGRSCWQLQPNNSYSFRDTCRFIATAFRHCCRAITDLEHAI